MIQIPKYLKMCTQIIYTDIGNCTRQIVQMYSNIDKASQLIHITLYPMV